MYEISQFWSKCIRAEIDRIGISQTAVANQTQNSNGFAQCEERDGGDN